MPWISEKDNSKIKYGIHENGYPQGTVPETTEGALGHSYKPNAMRHIPSVHSSDTLGNKQKEQPEYLEDRKLTPHNDHRRPNVTLAVNADRPAKKPPPRSTKKANVTETTENSFSNWRFLSTMAAFWFFPIGIWALRKSRQVSITFLNTFKLFCNPEKSFLLCKSVVRGSHMRSSVYNYVYITKLISYCNNAS